jgi:hypothetical protein
MRNAQTSTLKQKPDPFSLKTANGALEIYLRLRTERANAVASNSFLGVPLGLVVSCELLDRLILAHADVGRAGSLSFSSKRRQASVALLTCNRRWRSPGCANDCDRSLGRQLECCQVTAANLVSLPFFTVGHRVGVQPGKL